MSLENFFANQYVAGLLSGVVLSALGLLARFVYTTATVRRILRSNECLWLEVIREGSGTSYSIGRFYFDYHARAHFFDGEHFNATGDVETTWRSLAIRYVPKDRNIFYIYESQDGNQVRSHGFGFIDLGTNGPPIAHHGYFMGADASTSASTSVRRLVDYYPAVRTCQGIPFAGALDPDSNEFSQQKSKFIQELHGFKWTGPTSFSPKAKPPLITS